jgi:hypothetical protein
MRRISNIGRPRPPVQDALPAVADYWPFGAFVPAVRLARDRFAAAKP